MHKLKLVEFLSQFDDTLVAIEKLKSKYHIRVNQHSEHGNLFQFKYDQIDSPMGSQLVQECRGIILDSDDNWKVIAYPFNKFFNHTEGRAAKIKWDSCPYVYDKVDGSLITMYEYADKWHVASSGLPDAVGFAPDGSMTLGDLFRKVWNELGYPMPTRKGECYIFELATPSNKVVVPHTKSTITFIGARELTAESGYRELYIDSESFPLEWKRPRRFHVRSMQEAIDKCNEMNPMEQEGYVVVDNEFNRIKVKSPQYAAISHLGLTLEEIRKSSFDESKYEANVQKRWMLSIIMTNECDEFLGYLPQYTNLYNEVKLKYDRFREELESLYEKTKDIESQMEFALAIKHHPCSKSLFGIRNGKFASVSDVFRSMGFKKVYKLIK
jgi:hypothetical protein